MLQMSSFLEEDPLEQLPHVFRKMRDIQHVSEVNKKQYSKLNAAIGSLEDDNYFDTMSIDAVKRIESMCGIKASDEETLEFRRKRAKNRWNMSQPFSIPFLIQKLNAIIGEGKWEATISKDRTCLTIESFCETKQMYEEVEATINLLKPVKMVFKSKPLVPDSLLVKEYVNYSKLSYNIRLGKWRLGNTKLGNVSTATDVVGGNTMTLTDDCIDYLAKSVVENITDVIVNGTKLDTSIITTCKDGIATIEYTVPKNIGEKISKVQLIGSDGKEVSSISLYVPVTGDVWMKHKIAIKEGA